MREFQIVNQALHQSCPELHAKRLNSLMTVCEALFNSNTLTLTELGCRIEGDCHIKHNIKRMDRLLGNRHLHTERLAVYRWQATLICTAIMPAILVDWADIREKQRLMVLRGSVALSGRSVTVYERAFSLEEHNTEQAHNLFLHELFLILPQGCTPLIVTDAGFKNPWFRAVEQQGWYWLSRIRGRVNYADVDCDN